MALTSDDSVCSQVVGTKYKCKHLKTIKRSDLIEYYQNILAYRHHVKKEIVLLDQMKQQSLFDIEHQIPERNNHFIKYSKRRCNCKIKKISPDKKIDSNQYDKNHLKNTQETNSISNNKFKNIHFSETVLLASITSTSVSVTSEMCTSSILESIWHWKPFVTASPLSVQTKKTNIKTTTNSFMINPLKPQSPALKDCGSTLTDYEVKSCSFSIPQELKTKIAGKPMKMKFLYSSNKHEIFNWKSRTRTKKQPASAIETESTKFRKSAFCDNSNSSNVDKNNSHDTQIKELKLERITSQKNQSKFSISSSSSSTSTSKSSISTSTTSSISSSTLFECQQDKNPKFSYFMILMMVTIVKELIRHLSDNFKRMRRKTHVILPILVLLQLLIAAPFTHCSSSLITDSNQTLVSSSSSLLSTSPSVMSSSSSSHSPPVTSLDTKNSNFSVESKKVQSSSLETTSKVSQLLHRPTGGSSITSYINHEAKIRRDPSLSYINSGCHSCQMREQVKADNLESIKRHILLRLDMQTLPNITAPQVPRTIIENFYKNHSFQSEHNRKTTSSSVHNGYSNSHNNNQQKQQQQQLSKSSPSIAVKNSFNYTSLSDSSNRYVNDNSKKNDNNMQADDPNIFSSDYDQNIDNNKNQGYDKDHNNEDTDDDEELLKNDLEDEFFSVTNSVYVFPTPTMPRMRHNRKAEILNFKFKSNEHSTISQALLHVYIRGRDWIRENASDLLDNIKNNINEDHREIIITIHRVIRRINSTIATHTVNVTESQHKIPNGAGHWISIDVTQLVQGWVRNTTTNQGIVIKAAESWMKPFIITSDLTNNKAFTVYIEMVTKDNRKRRTKRNTSMNCSESDNEERCCRYPLVVNFVEFDWTWVVAPTSFNAYFCNGECKLGFLEKYPHTHLMQLSTAPQPCCSPTKMSPLKLLYFNTENTLVMSTIPNMAVEKCSCS